MRKKGPLGKKTGLVFLFMLFLCCLCELLWGFFGWFVSGFFFLFLCVSFFVWFVGVFCLTF